MTTPLTQEQAITISAYTGILACDFNDLHRAVQKKLGRRVELHEIGAARDEIREAFAQDFLALIPRKIS